ncbi:Chemotaxis phosphatase CheX [Sporobacter termitidis DSM 10068]|uniref:Stage 0 sporulation protein A homolog n=1 Tax=Sporobacter termitidis DSM 10068 TaxID=1123282 RepID=A0A1M5Z207_9FIRM|nr:response regulator [Sporobacter termitidis]SHI18276.1 Chemotaxis phosphatase CheX [Sporobacter termitidis DSM 10068]
MKEINIVVVDDSPFSVAMISNILTGSGFNVIGSANGLEEAVEAVKTLQPDVVTMDITMPGADGIECTNAIHKVVPRQKVVIVSSMMDEEIIRRAKKAKVSGYVQKPVDAEELTLAINRVMADEELFIELEGLYTTVFKEALTDSFNKLFKTVPEFEAEFKNNNAQVSRGISVVIGIIGKYSGRLILDMSNETARHMAGTMMNSDALPDEYIVNIVGEVSNIAAGNACSLMNKTNKLFGLRVAPPTIVYGESITISKSDFDTAFSVTAQTTFGEIFMNVGFNRGEYQ